MRFVIVGAGAVGSLLAAHLARAGEPVVMVARPDHAAAVRTGGLRVLERDATEWLAHPAAETAIAAAAPQPGDVAILTVKCYDTAAAVAELAAAAPRGVHAVVCFQNGVANEATTAASFSTVYAVMPQFSARLLAPGAVFAAGNRRVQIGRYPQGVDSTVESLVARIGRAGVEASGRPDVMAAKWSKLIMNCVNAVYAICNAQIPTVRTDPVLARLVNVVWAEAERVLAAAGIAHDPVPALPIPQPGDGGSPAGSWGPGSLGTTVTPIAGSSALPPYYGSSWDDLARGLGQSELPWLNGEIVRLAQRHGVPAPANALLLQIGNEMAERREPPGRCTPAELLAAVETGPPPAARAGGQKKGRR